MIVTIKNEKANSEALSNLIGKQIFIFSKFGTKEWFGFHSDKWVLLDAILIVFFDDEKWKYLQVKPIFLPNLPKIEAYSFEVNPVLMTEEALQAYKFTISLEGQYLENIAIFNEKHEYSDNKSSLLQHHGITHLEVDYESFILLTFDNGHKLMLQSSIEREQPAMFLFEEQYIKETLEKRRIKYDF